MLGKVEVSAIKSRHNLEAIAGKLVNLRKAGKVLQGACPKCGGSQKSTKFTIYPKEQSFHCFGCGAGGDVIKFVQWTQGLDFAGAVEVLGGGAALSLPAIVPTAKPNPVKPAKLCACGRELESEGQKRAGKCYHCTVAAAYERGAGGEADFLAFDYCRRKRLPTAILIAAHCKIGQVYGRPVLIVPVKNTAGQAGYQTISESGAKLWAWPVHDEAADWFYTILGDESAELIACEGFATGVSIRAALPDKAVLITGNCGNLVKAAQHFGHQITTIAADNDKSGAGLAKAREAGQLAESSIWLSPVDDFNDLHTAKGLEAVAVSFANDITPPERRRVNMASLEGLTLPESGVVILNSAMGTGKTKHIMTVIRRRAASSVAIANLKNLVEGLAQNLESVSYTKTDKPAAHLAVCINSIAKYEANYEAVLIDEFDGCLDTLTTGRLMTDKEKVAAIKALANIIAGAKLVVLASATMLPAHLEAVKLLAGGRPVSVIENTWRPAKRLVFLPLADWLQLLWGTVEAGQKVFSFVDSKSKVEALEADLNTMGIKTLAIHSDNSEKTMPIITTGGYTDYQVLIGSPSIRAGVSLEAKHFDVTMCLFGSTDLSPLEAIQAYGRNRHATTIYACFSSNHRQADIAGLTAAHYLAEIRASHRQTLAEAYDLCNHLTAEVKAEALAYFDESPAVVTDLVTAEIKAGEAELTANWIKSHFEIARGAGFEIVGADYLLETFGVITKSEADKEAAAAIAADIKIIKEATYERIAAIDLAGVDGAKLAQKRERSQTEEETFIKWEAQTTFGQSDKETIKAVLTSRLHEKAGRQALHHSPAYVLKKAESDIAGYFAGEKSLTGTKNILAAHQLTEALCAVAGVKLLAGGGYDFTGAAELTAATDYNEIEAIVTAHRLTLGLGRFTAGGHKLAMRLLRDWLGFKVEAKQNAGGKGYTWRVSGQGHELLDAGRQHKVNKLAGVLFA